MRLHELRGMADLWKQNVRGQIIPADLFNNDRIYRMS